VVDQLITTVYPDRQK
ncbi:acetyl-CoA synthetase, partial [Acinetobacter baumannii]